MQIISPEEWQPSDGLNLEANALISVKSLDNRLVLAGPGAGKTEMLAQRASYLLETNTCKYPHKILAISFKKDASFNLKERVEKRCGEDLSKRFDSFTFDSFAKQILDRFKKALPEGVNVSADYELLLNDNEVLEIYSNRGESLIYSHERKRMMAMHNKQLPIDFNKSSNGMIYEVWLELINSTQSKLTFAMIMRLAELIIKTNPKIKKYLQLTYQFVFLDEFQDTTRIQYDLFKTCFLSSDSIFTAVGDDKQRIMLWAGAIPTVFEDFKNDTGASEIHLHRNYRSAPKIVNLLNHFSEHMLGDVQKATADTRWDEDDGDCNIVFFKNTEQEKVFLLDSIHSLITEDHVNPRDICILIKQRLDVYAGELITYLCEHGIQARDEGYFYDLLSEEITLFIINILYRVLNNKDSATRKATFDFISNLYSELDHQGLLNIEKKLFEFIKHAEITYDFDNLTTDTLKQLIKEAIKLINTERLKAQFPKYKNQKELSRLLTKLYKELWKAYQASNSLGKALDTIVGKDTIPVMTIHKSKGLEYHTVIFVGLEDDAFWSYQNQPNEDNCAFFVALSRAKENILFTFSQTRKDNRGRLKSQSFKNIEPIINTMNKSRLVGIVDEIGN
ncbi:UvrD-helicase domain-containing protein [Psychrobacter sanguinis]|uniref:UvrD-helicase domain-containing protein n=1 Tax=Psychrobacter sanguinis TaxID=861445 RepID=UPI001D1250B8|nr:ATP-dependent helicase [Psychrobacter sanguinis]MCC3308976.1 ATP-dependent helicase [Psychrobacter sanguinis]UEC26265.1 ATP-dependent helicase [Psychrobacter sanguinis]